MKTWHADRCRRWTLQLVLAAAIAGGAGAQPYIDGDYPGFSFEAGAEVTVSGNPLDRGDRIYSLRASYRQPAGRLGFEAAVGVAEPTSPFVQALGPDADLLLVDLSLAWYLNYPPEIDRSCGGSADREGIQPWHCGQRIKAEYIVFGGPGWAFLEIDDAPPPLPAVSEDFFTLNLGFAVKLYWLSTTSEELAPGLAYDARRTSRWYLRPEVRARWFDGGGSEIDWGVGLALGYGFGGGDTHGALCLQIEEACYLSARVTERVAGEDGEVRGPENAPLFTAVEERRTQLQDYRARAVAAGVECGACLARSIDALNESLNKLR